VVLKTQTSVGSLARKALSNVNNAADNKNRINFVQSVIDGSLPDLFIDDMRQYSKTEFGGDIRWSPALYEILQLLSDFRVDEVYTSGIAQYSKTFSHSQLCSWLSQRANIRTLWAFPSQTTMLKLQPQQHAPILNLWTKANKIKPSQSTGKQNVTTYSVGAGVANYSFNKVGSAAGAAAGSSAVAVTADVLFVEERSQWQPAGSDKVFHRRIDNGILREINKFPIRVLGTPGSGAGIEKDIKDAKHNFWPYAKCPHCEDTITLTPLGCLFKKVVTKNKDNSLIERYFDETGLPLDWHHKDPDDPVRSAYFGCSSCGELLPDDLRQKAKFHDINTGMTLDEFLTSYVPSVWREETLTVGIWGGLLFRDQPGTKLAPAVVGGAQDVTGMADYLQQRCGIPGDVIGGSITRENIKSAIEREDFYPTEDETSVTLIGIDQGRSAWYAAVVEFIYNENLPPSLAMKTVRRNIKAFRILKEDEVPALMEEWGPVAGLIDNEPSISSASALADDLGLCLGNQQKKQKDEYKFSHVLDGGNEYECYQIRYNKYVWSLMVAFVHGQVTIPDEYEHHLEFNTPKSIVRHLTAVEWDNTNACVVKKQDEPDDLFFALMFAEASFALYLQDPENFVKSGNFNWYAVF
jgi:hypothetical protein